MAKKFQIIKTCFTEVVIRSAAIISYLPKHKAKDQEQQVKTNEYPEWENLLLYTANFVYKSVSNFVYISRGQIKEEICIHERSTQR